MTTSWATFWLSVSEISQRRTGGFSAGLLVLTGRFGGDFAAKEDIVTAVSASNAIDSSISLRTSNGLGLGFRLCLWSSLNRLSGQAPGEQPGNRALEVDDFVRAFVDHYVGASGFGVEAKVIGETGKQNNR